MEKNIRRKYPLTEQSKRERITQIRMKNESKCQQIKKNNETIKRGAEAIRVYSFNILIPSNML